MPIYEYLCHKCQTIFSLTMSMTEHGQNQVICPKCRGRQVTQQYTAFYAKTSKKS